MKTLMRYVRDWFRARKVNADFDKFIRAMGKPPSEIYFRFKNEKSGETITVNSNQAFVLLCDYCRRIFVAGFSTSPCPNCCERITAPERKKS